MCVHVVSKRAGGDQPVAGDTIVYIGRPSILGNPFAMVSEGHRSTVIRQYREWLRVEYAKKGPVFDALHALAKRVREGEHLALQCWCAPRACHGDVIKDAIEGINLKA